MAFIKISQAMTNSCQNSSVVGAGQRGGCVTPIPGSPNQHDLSSCQTSCSAPASSACDRTPDAISCVSHGSDTSPCEGFIPIASGIDSGIGSHNLGSKDNIYFRKRSGRGRGWKRGSKSSGGKSTSVMVDSKRRKTMKTKADGSNNKNKQMSDCVSALEQPYMFYKRAMVIDPWRQLKPIVGCILVGLPSTLESPRLWLPDSVAPKEPELSRSDETSSQVRQRRLDQDRSLADCLAMSFQEAANE